MFSTMLLLSVNAEAGIWDSKFYVGACAQLPGAQALQTSGAVVIAGLVGAIGEAKRVRDMREYPFWARGAESFEILRSAAPGKILRDSPTRRDTPPKNC